MLKYGWTALGVVALAVAAGPVRADGPATEVAAPAETGPGSCGSCSSCGEHGGCVSRLMAFLSFCPTRGKCCQCECEGCPPPLYTFFPCTGCGAGAGVTGCTSSGNCGGRVLRFNKLAGACSTCSNSCNGNNGGCHRLTTFRPSCIKPEMPCLPPDRFRQGCGCGATTPAAGGCPTCSTFAPPIPVTMGAPVIVTSPATPGTTTPVPAGPQ